MTVTIDVGQGQADTSDERGRVHQQVEKGNGASEGKLMQGPRDTYSRLLRNAINCLVPEESLPSSSLLLYLVILLPPSGFLSFLAIAIPQEPNLPLLWSAVSAPYLYNLIILPWERLWRKNGLVSTLVAAGGIALAMALPTSSLHLEVAPDYPFEVTLSFLAINTAIGWMYHKSIPGLLTALLMLTLAVLAATTFRPSPKVFPCVQQAVEDMCRDMHREGKTCSKAIHYTRQVAEGYLEGIEGQTLFWAILGAAIIDKVPPFLTGLIDKTSILIIQMLLQISLQMLRPFFITYIGTTLLMIALHAFLHVHIIHAVEEYKLQHPEEE